MAKQEHNKLARADLVLFVAGLVAATLMAIYIAGFLKGLVGYLIIEFILYAAIVVVYIQAFRTSRTVPLVLLARVVSYAGIAAVILIASFIAYFVATFRW